MAESGKRRREAGNVKPKKATTILTITGREG